MLKKYSITDLISHPDYELQADYGNYAWTKRRGLLEGNVFRVETAENTIFSFNLYIGEVISVAKNRYKYKTLVFKNDLTISLSGIYKSSYVSTYLQYQGLNTNNEHHWMLGQHYINNEFTGDADGNRYRWINKLPVLEGGHTFEIDPETSEVIQKDVREVDFSTKIDNNLNITIREASYGSFESISALLVFQGADVDNNYYWTLKDYEITTLWPKGHKK